MQDIIMFSKFIGPAFWLLLPLSVIVLCLVMYVCWLSAQKKMIDKWVETILFFAKETAAMIGLLGSVYALAGSFKTEGNTVEEIRRQMFLILGTGFWSTIAGIIVSLKASFGLLIKDLNSKEPPLK